jgi:hypothetical protein
MDLIDLLTDAKRRGFTHNFAYDDDCLHCADNDERVTANDARIVESNAVDVGTDPGDDATVYLIETASGLRGYLITSDAFHTDPRKAAFVDGLRR